MLKVSADDCSNNAKISEIYDTREHAWVTRGIVLIRRLVCCVHEKFQGKSPQEGQLSRHRNSLHTEEVSSGNNALIEIWKANIYIYCSVNTCKKRVPKSEASRGEIMPTKLSFSFFHSGYFYSASPSQLLLRGVPDTAWLLCRSLHAEAPQAAEWRICPRSLHGS